MWWHSRPFSIACREVWGWGRYGASLMKLNPYLYFNLLFYIKMITHLRLYFVFVHLGDLVKDDHFLPNLHLYIYVTQYRLYNMYSCWNLLLILAFFFIVCEYLAFALLFNCAHCYHPNSYLWCKSPNHLVRLQREFGKATTVASVTLSLTLGQFITNTTGSSLSKLSSTKDELWVVVKDWYKSGFRVLFQIYIAEN